MEKINEATARFEENQAHQIPEVLAILPLRNAVIYPHISMPIVISGAESIALVEETFADKKILGIVTQRLQDAVEPTSDQLYTVGTAVELVNIVRTPEGKAYTLIQGISRIKIESYLQETPYQIARVEVLPDIDIASKELAALMNNVKEVFAAIAKVNSHISQEALDVILNVDKPGLLADMVAENPNFSIQERQEVLETLDVKARLQQILLLLIREKDLAELNQKIHTKVHSEMNKTQREFYLRKQLEAIREELGEDDSQNGEIAELRQRLQEKPLPDDVRKTADKELDRLSKIPTASAEYTVARTYLDWILDLPWDTRTDDNLDILKAEEILEADHYGLKHVKKRILEYLAVRQLTQAAKGPILCFVGPPGVGKTSLGHSIARALDREFVRISLGGIRDEAEIRGHRRTYVGALPGRIIQGIKKAGTKNPVFMLDEVDKIGTDFRGDPASALLEVLDPEQNHTFADHYLELTFDLSGAMFIATANVLSTIPAPLRDRMEVIEIAGYTEEEKQTIARHYLIPRQLKANGIEPEQLTILESAVATLIRSYTREAGVRNLERELASICRGVAKTIVDGHREPIDVQAERVARYCGPIKFFHDMAERVALPGVATGLAWTPGGGDILFIETAKMKGHDKLILTGQLGEVMKESAEIALSYVRSKASDLGLPENFSENTDVHVHVPSGAIPKDGPSAGVTLYTSLVSLFTEKPVRIDTAMTGEVTLRGAVLPVGGIKEKVLAARSAGVKHVILPAKNEKDLEDVPEHVKAALSFHFVQSMDEVLDFALNESS